MQWIIKIWVCSFIIVIRYKCAHCQNTTEETKKKRNNHITLIEATINKTMHMLCMSQLMEWFIIYDV